MKLTLSEWIQYGIDNNYCSREYCDTHDGLPNEDRAKLEELWRLSEGDHCMTVVAINSGEIESQLDYFKSEEAKARRQSLIEPVKDFL